MKPITDYRHFDYDPPAWRTNQRVGTELQAPAILTWLALLGMAFLLTVGPWLVFRFSGMLAAWVMQR